MLLRYLNSMSNLYEIFPGFLHAKPFDNDAYLHGLGYAKQPAQSISIDMYSEYISCLSQILHREDH